MSSAIGLSLSLPGPYIEVIDYHAWLAPLDIECDWLAMYEKDGRWHPHGLSLDVPHPHMEFLHMLAIVAQERQRSPETAIFLAIQCSTAQRYVRCPTWLKTALAHASTYTTNYPPLTQPTSPSADN
jgi:hypothetical protein